MNIVLFGAPGSGKGTQAGQLQSELGLTHIASGDLFRYNINNKTELGLTAQKYMNRGDLVPDDVTVAMIRDRMQQPDTANGILLDGFPRTLAQARALDQMLAEMGKKVDGVLYLDVTDEELVSRLAGRMICRECQAPFHKRFKPFEECPYDKCEGEHLYQRDDDKPETVRARLKTFYTQTTPLIDHYKNAGMLVTIPGEGAVGEITEAMLAAARAL